MLEEEPQIQHEPKPPFPKQHQEQPRDPAECNNRRRYQAPNYKAAGKLIGKAALITGGDSGIGRAVAVLYAREGADVAIVYLPEEQRTPTRRNRPSRPRAGGACRSPAT